MNRRLLVRCSSIALLLLIATSLPARPKGPASPGAHLAIVLDEKDTSAVPAADPGVDQPTIDLEPRRIQTSTAAGIRLQAALDLITNETGSRVFWGDIGHKELFQEPKEIELEGKTFWEAYGTICAAWGLYAADIRPRSSWVRLRAGVPEEGTENPLGSGWLWDGCLAPAATSGAFKLMYQRGTDDLRVRLWPESRLRYFQIDRAQLQVLGANGKRVTLPPKPLDVSVYVTQNFEGKDLPATIKSIALQCELIYPHDWQVSELGRLSECAKRKKPIKVGLVQFVIQAVRTATSKKGIQGIEVDYQFSSRMNIQPEDLRIVLPDTKSILAVHDHHEEGRWMARSGPFKVFYALPDISRLRDLELCVRAPTKTARLELKHVLDVR